LLRRQCLLAMTETNMPDITLRPGTDADLPAILDMWVLAWTATMPDIDFEARRPWKANRLKTMVSEGATLTVAAWKQVIVGGTLVNIANRDLDQLVVAPAAWGKGVAKALVIHARQLCPNGLSLTVNQENPRAIRFYEREGFVRVGEGTNPNSGRAIYHYAWTPS
jgi:putative acetyltransferase